MDGSVSDNQGIRYIFADGSRFVFRLSGAMRWPAAVNSDFSLAACAWGLPVSSRPPNRCWEPPTWTLTELRLTLAAAFPSPAATWLSQVNDFAGTGSSGATIRMYIEKYVPPEAGHDALSLETAEAVAPLVKAALTISNLVKLTGRNKPTVIT